MDQLWAPWRMAYIGGQPEPGCLFCRVLADPAKDEENFVLFRPAGALVMLNRFPYNSGHLLIAPIRHTGELAELAADEVGALMSALQRMLTILGEVVTPDGFNLGANLGRTAGAGIPDHVHFHVVPRWNGDTNFMPVLAETKVINEHLMATAAKLRAALAAG
ncbi:MAG: HIT domain-containing protein [Chloroflexi bacterium]|nr:MAG: HIT domain-containing protein [Chloroflexota bacterium]TMD55218.1 MAG: HIT domain-containing protein [Chloroflexota bacterium]